MAYIGQKILHTYILFFWGINFLRIFIAVTSEYLSGINFLKITLHIFVCGKKLHGELSWNELLGRLNCPKYPLLRDILGNLRVTFLQSWVIFAFFCVLGVVGHRGFYNRSKRMFSELNFAIISDWSVGLPQARTTVWKPAFRDPWIQLFLF